MSGPTLKVEAEHYCRLKNEHDELRDALAALLNEIGDCACDDGDEWWGFCPKCGWQHALHARAVLAKVAK